MTNPELQAWPVSRGPYRRSEVSARVGQGDEVWERAVRDLLRWEVKIRSGFSVDSRSPVIVGERVLVTARVLGIRVIEPVEVASVVAQPDRVGFSYRAAPGHPVDGEEAFIVHRDGDAVWLSIRSLTRAAPQQPWRTLYPLLRLVQRVVRKRYLRSLA